MGNKYRKKAKMLAKIERNGGAICDMPKKTWASNRINIPKRLVSADDAFIHAMGDLYIHPSNNYSEKTRKRLELN